MRVLRVAVGSPNNSPIGGVFGGVPVAWGAVRYHANAWRHLPNPSMEGYGGEFSFYARCAATIAQFSIWWPDACLRALATEEAEAKGLRVFVCEVSRACTLEHQVVFDLRRVLAYSAFTVREFLSSPDACYSADLVPVEIDRANSGKVSFRAVLAKARVSYAGA